MTHSLEITALVARLRSLQFYTDGSGPEIPNFVPVTCALDGTATEGTLTVGDLRKAADLLTTAGSPAQGEIRLGNCEVCRSEQVPVRVQKTRGGHEWCACGDCLNESWKIGESLGLSGYLMVVQSSALSPEGINRDCDIETIADAVRAFHCSSEQERRLLDIVATLRPTGVGQRRGGVA